MTAEFNYPRAFGRYVLIDHLGRGGMGSVHLAKQSELEGIERYCVLKTLRAGSTRAPEQVARFLDEARVMVQLNHRNICRVFDVGEVGDELYLAMDLVSGCDLRELLHRCRSEGVRLPLAMVCFVVRELCAALDYAHNLSHAVTGERLDLVHRDVSPANVMLSFDGDVQLIDFGLAASSLKQHQTRQGEVLGKLAYMSPEQLRGEPVGAPADLYAAGIIAYELLSARPFFEGTPLDDLWAGLSKNKAPLPDWETVPEGLRTVVREATSQKLSRRLKTVGLLRDAVVEFERARGLNANANDLKVFLADLFPEGPEALRAKLSEHSSASKPSPPSPAVEVEDEIIVRRPNFETSALNPHATMVLQRPSSDTEVLPRRRTGALLGAVLGLVVLVGGGLAWAFWPPNVEGPADTVTTVAVVEQPVAAVNDAGHAELPVVDAGANLDLNIDVDVADAGATSPTAKKRRRLKKRRRARARHTQTASTKTDLKPVLNTKKAKLKFLRRCAKSCAKKLSKKASNLQDLPPHEIRPLFDAVDRCVTACGG